MLSPSAQVRIHHSMGCDATQINPREFMSNHENGIEWLGLAVVNWGVGSCGNSHSVAVVTAPFALRQPVDPFVVSSKTINKYLSEHACSQHLSDLLPDNVGHRTIFNIIRMGGGGCRLYLSLSHSYISIVSNIVHKCLCVPVRASERVSQWMNIWASPGHKDVSHGYCKFKSFVVRSFMKHETMFTM